MEQEAPRFDGFHFVKKFSEVFGNFAGRFSDGFVEVEGFGVLYRSKEFGRFCVDISIGVVFRFSASLGLGFFHRGHRLE
jgi:hypothetical protein